MKIAFMGTPAFGAEVLRRIVEAGHEVVCLFCQPDSPKGRDPQPVAPEAKVCAAAFSIPVLQPGRIGPKSTAKLVELAPDAIVVAAYGHILPPRVLTIPRHGAINVHTSLLPRHRGAAPIRWAIASGDKITGVTIMQMAEGLDTGDILAQAEEPILDDDTWLTLQDRLALLGADQIVKVLARLARGETVPPVPQDDSKATWARPLRKEDAALDWSWDCSTIANRCRAFYPWPGTQTLHKGRRLKLFPLLRRVESAALQQAVEPAPGSKQAGADRTHLASKPAPGTVLAISPAGMTVACGDGALLIPEVQLEGKRRLPAYEFASGARLSPGVLLGA